MSKARDRPGVDMIDTRDLQELVRGRQLESGRDPMQIESFSNGFFGNSLALEATPDEYARVAEGSDAPQGKKTIRKRISGGQKRRA